MLRDALLGESAHGCALMCADSDPYDPARIDAEYWEHTQLVYALRSVKAYLIEQLQESLINVQRHQDGLEGERNLSRCTDLLR